MTTTTTGTLKVPGASLYYEVRGSGPLLLLVAGAPADAGTFAALADQLADHHTVVTYDWRGAARSPLDEPADDPAEGLPMQVQGDDAELLLAALADDRHGCLVAAVGRWSGWTWSPTILSGWRSWSRTSRRR
jgi:pimeloyl-ACP methyl ester carboxylesterase